MGVKGRKFTYYPGIKREGDGWRMECAICNSGAKYGDMYQANRMAIAHKPICGKVIA